MQSKLSLRGVSKSYGLVKALRETSLDVPEGEFLTLLGPSGSGKTTLLSLLAGLTEPDAGEIWIDNELATYAPPHKRDIGMVFQNYALFPHLTVFENIAFPLRMRRMGQAELKKRIARVLEVVHLPHVADRYPRELSGGQQQRIALARCAVYEPSIILMDEPLGALDKKLRDSMQLEIKRIHKELQATILYVTHDQEEALAMSDRICLMNNGGIEQLDTPAELYFRPKTVFAADFLGGANMLACKLAAREGGDVVLTGPLEKPFRAEAAGSSIAPEESAFFMVRPEHIRLLEQGEQIDNAVEATIEHVVMNGPLSRLYTRLDDGTPLQAAVLTVKRHGSLQAGGRVHMGWDKHHTVMLTESTAR